MDTRNKIIDYQEALAIARDRPVRWVTGHFDPLLAAHARHVSESIQDGALVIAVVTNPADPLLPQRARAELVAALAGVDYVAMKDGDEGPEQVTLDFVRHVLERHGA